MGLYSPKTCPRLKIVTKFSLPVTGEHGSFLHAMYKVITAISYKM